jgi:hypothetical protein
MEVMDLTTSHVCLCARVHKKANALNTRRTAVRLALFSMQLVLEPGEAVE